MGAGARARAPRTEPKQELVADDGDGEAKRAQEAGKIGKREIAKITEVASRLVGEPTKESPSIVAGTTHVIDVAILRDL